MKNARPIAACSCRIEEVTSSRSGTIAPGTDMKTSRFSRTVVRSGLASIILGGASVGMCCLNEYDRDPPNPELNRMREAGEYLERLYPSHPRIEPPSDDELTKLQAAAEQGDYRAKSNYAVALARHGDAREAIYILQQVEAEHPGEYIVAANLGTAYELAGDNQLALEWITTGLRRNPDSHEKSEWVHVKILQAKLATAKDPAWLKSHSILGLDFGAAAEPRSPAEAATDADGHVRSLADVRVSLEYQLRERLSLVAAPDLVVSSLLGDLGNILVLYKLPRHAYRVYALAANYAPEENALLGKRLQYVSLTYNRPAQYYELWLPSFLIGGALCVVLAIGWYLKDRLRNRSRMPA